MQVIYLGTDHRGFELKEEIKGWLSSQNFGFEDLGAFSYNEDDDYPDFAAKVAERVSENPEENKGILLCGSGVGVDVVANKFPEVRSALVWSDDEGLVKQSREHDGSNVLSLPADHLAKDQAISIVKTWLEASDPKEERHLRRIKKITNLEN